MGMTDFDCTAIATAADRQWYSRTLAHVFLSSPEAELAYLNRVGPHHCLLVRRGSERAGGLVTIPMGQWFGGRCVPMTGIASVAIAPEYRGQRAALALVRSALHKLHADGAALSVLYPAVQALYRSLGYEQGGSYCGWEIDTQLIQMRGGGLPVKAVPIDTPTFTRLYARQARASAGHLDRHPCIWQQKLAKAATEPLYAYTFGEGDRAEGYVLYRQATTPTGTVAQIEDWCLLTAAAAQTFWSFWTAHRSQVNQLRWYGGAIDDFAALLPEPRVKPRFSDRWLLRIIDVERALLARGYPAHLEAELHIEVEDELISANCDRFILRVSAGKAEIERGGTGAMTLSVRGLAPLYSGLFAPAQLCRMGYLEGSEAAQAIAAQLFAGSAPWMPDFF